MCIRDRLSVRIVQLIDVNMYRLIDVKVLSKPVIYANHLFKTEIADPLKLTLEKQHILQYSLPTLIREVTKKKKVDRLTTAVLSL